MSFQSYSFGRIVYADVEYKKDIYVTTSGSVKQRSDYCYKKFGTGHVLSKEELEKNIDSNTKLLVVGLGANSAMKIQPEVQKWLKQQHIELIAEDTGSAIQTFNKLQYKQKTFGVFHLTC